MKRFIVILLIVIAVPVVMLPFAEAGGKVEVGRMTCGDLLELLQKDKNLAGAVLIWVDGYVSSKGGRSEFNQAKITNFAKKIGEYCARNPKVNLLSAAEKISRN